MPQHEIRPYGLHYLASRNPAHHPPYSSRARVRLRQGRGFSHLVQHIQPAMLRFCETGPWSKDFPSSKTTVSVHHGLLSSNEFHHGRGGPLQHLSAHIL